MQLSQSRPNVNTSLETQGQLVGAGKSLKGGREKKNLGEVKSRTRRRALLRVLDFSSPEFFSRPLRLFPAPSNCPWISEDDVNTGKMSYCLILAVLFCIGNLLKSRQRKSLFDVMKKGRSRKIKV